MRKRPTFNWDSALRDLRETRQAEQPKALTAEQLAAQRQAQRDARVNSVMRSGLSQRNRV